MGSFFSASFISTSNESVYILHIWKKVASVDGLISNEEDTLILFLSFFVEIHSRTFISPVLFRYFQYFILEKKILDCFLVQLVSFYAIGPLEGIVRLQTSNEKSMNSNRFEDAAEPLHTDCFFILSRGFLNFIFLSGVFSFCSVWRRSACKESSICTLAHLPT